MNIEPNNNEDYKTRFVGICNGMQPCCNSPTCYWNGYENGCKHTMSKTGMKHEDIIDALMSALEHFNTRVNPDTHVIYFEEKENEL